MMEKLKAIGPQTWLVIVIAVGLAAVDALNRYAGVGIEIPGWVIGIIGPIAAARKPTN